MKFAIVLLCFIVFVQAVFGENEDEAWEAFKAKYRKGLKGPAEALRKRNFVSRWKKATEHNKKFASGEATFEVALGEDADVPLETLRKFRNGRVPNTGNATAINPKVPKNMKGAIPASVDWTKSGIVTPVKQQGSCGSCYTFSTAAYLESQLLKAKKVSKIDLAEQQSVDCSRKFGNNGCGGGLEKNVFRYYEKARQQLEASYKYTGKAGTCKAKPALGKVTVTKIYSEQYVSEDYLKNLLATRGPICVSMYASDDLLQDYRSGIYSCPECPTDVRSMDHAVLAVGYGTEDGEDYWLIKNSWGISWGENGYLKIARANNTAGILSDITYADLVYSKK